MFYPLGQSGGDRVVFNEATQLWERGDAAALNGVYLMYMFGTGTPAFSALRYLPFAGDGTLTNSLSVPWVFATDVDGALLSGYVLSGNAGANSATMQLYVDGVGVGTAVTETIPAGLTENTLFTFPDAVFSAGQRVGVGFTPGANWDRDFAFVGKWRLGS